MAQARPIILPSAIVAALAGAALGAAPASATASAPLPTAVAAPEPSTTTAINAAPTASDAEQDGLERYWTKKRLLSAVPVPDPVERRPADFAAAVPGPTGKPGSVAPAAPMDKAAAAWPPRRASVVGKVFFLSGGRRWACSASALNSPSKQLVITAGHCVFRAGDYVRKWVFIPKYHNGSKPFGVFAAKQFRTFDSWREKRNYHRDVAMVTTYRVRGRKLVNRVGGNGLTWNRPRFLHYTLVGYPLDHSHGEIQWFFQGNSRHVSLFDPRIEVKCDFGGGSSGGPFLLNFNERTRQGVVNGVISTGEDWTQSPYFDGAVKDMYVDQGRVT